MESTSILVADDDDRIQAVMGRLLGGSDTRMLFASDGPQAMEHARRQIPDVIILDVEMPGMNGFDVCAALRRDYRTRHIPIIFLTGGAGPAKEVYGLNIGADDYVSKPFDAESLKARIVAMLHRSKMSLGLNPLTRLPGNRVIRMEAESRLRSGRPFTLVYADIRHFKKFNDACGFSLGDEVILEAGRLLREVAQAPGVDAFIGHIGGDDFVLISDRPVDLRSLAALFEHRVALLPGTKGGPRIDLTLAELQCEAGVYRNYDELALAATRVKEELRRGGSSGK